MREFNRLYSGTVENYFLNAWMSHDEKFLIQEEIKDGYGIFPLTNDMSKDYAIAYYKIPFDKRRHTTMRNCLESYYKIKNEL